MAGGCSRRDFLNAVGLGMGSLAVTYPELSDGRRGGLRSILAEAGEKPAQETARDESFWREVQQAFDVDRSIINLNTGGTHPAPATAMDSLHRHLDFANAAPVHNSWRWLRPRKELVRSELAQVFGCSPEEIALTRNVTEALDIALLGLDLRPGDEVLTTTHDYPSMKNALLQRQKRDGVVVRMFPFPVPPASPEELTGLFARHISPRTRLILVCHITNTIGQIFPIRDICRLARSKGIEVVVDGAHALGHFDFKVGDLECDFYGVTLHKWMMAPIGTGFLYVKKGRAKDLWPLFPAPDPMSDDVRKFEFIGTSSEPLIMSISEALAFHNGLGAARKEARLRYLREYWTRALSALPGVRILTSPDPRMSCGIATFTVEGLDLDKFAQVLLDRHQILVTPVSWSDKEKGVRVTPSLFTSLNELDLFIEAASRYIRQGLPA